MPRYAGGVHAGRRRRVGLDRAGGFRPRHSRGASDGPADRRDVPWRRGRDRGAWSDRVAGAAKRRRRTEHGDRGSLGARRSGPRATRYPRDRSCAGQLHHGGDGGTHDCRVSGVVGHRTGAHHRNRRGLSGRRRVTERILVIKLGALGDFVQAMGPAAAIRAHHPQAEITLLTSPELAGLAKAAPYFDRVWLDDRPGWVRPWALWRLLRKLSREGFARVYDLQTSD